MLDPDDFGKGPLQTLAHVADTTPPVGFDRFWSDALGRLLGDDPEPTITERTTPDPTDASCTHEVAGFGGVALGAGLFVPDAAPVRAGLVTLHGAGVPRTIAEEHDRWRRLVARGVAVCALRVRGFPGSTRRCPQFARTPPELWGTVGLDDPAPDPADEHSAPLSWSVIAAALDVVNACRALRRWLDQHADGAPLMLRGESLGGGLAVIGAGLIEHHRVDAITLDRLAIGLPTFGDWGFRARHPGYGQGRAIVEAVVRAREHGPEIVRRLELADAAIHATRVHTPVLAKLAERDEVVPAPSAAAVFNALRTPGSDRWRFVTPYGHHDGGIAHARRDALFERCLLDYLDPVRTPHDAMRRWLPVLVRGERLAPAPAPVPELQPAGAGASADIGTGSGLFGDDDLTPTNDGLSPFDHVLIAEYQRIGRTLDDLPYTDAFESLYIAIGAEALNRTRRAIFHRLHNLRKAGRLPRLGRSGESRPVIDHDDERLLVDLVVRHAGTVGQRDRLPYTPEMDRLAETFRERTAHDLGLHELWRVIAKLAK